MTEELIGSVAALATLKAEYDIKQATAKEAKTRYEDARQILSESMEVEGETRVEDENIKKGVYKSVRKNKKINLERGSALATEHGVDLSDIMVVDPVKLEFRLLSLKGKGVDIDSVYDVTETEYITLRDLK